MWETIVQLSTINEHSWHVFNMMTIDDQVNVQMCQEGLWSSSICLKLVRWTPFRHLLWARCPGWAALTMGPQVRWVDLGHRKIRTSIGFRYQNLGWSIDELSHNSKVMQAKAPSMHSITSKQKYHEQVLNIESSRIQWQCCIWSWIELESVLLSFQFYKWNSMGCFELTVNWLEAFSQVAEKLGLQPPSPLPHSRRKPGLWTIRTNMKELHLGCCMQQISCPFWLICIASPTQKTGRPAEAGLEEPVVPPCQMPGTKATCKRLHSTYATYKKSYSKDPILCMIVI